MALVVYGGGIGLAVLAKATTRAVLNTKPYLTPLCKCFLKQRPFEFIIKWDGLSDDFDVVEAGEGNSFMCNVRIERIDKESSPHGVVATARLCDSTSSTLATVVARTKAIAGQEVTICREGTEIFAFMQADGELYHARHKTGERLLTMCGDANNCNVSFLHPTGLQVGFVQREGNFCKGFINGSNADVGLMIASLIATRFFGILVSKGALSVPPAPPALHQATSHKIPSMVLQQFGDSSLSRRLPPVWLAAHVGCGLATLCPLLPSQLLGPVIGSFTLGASATIRAAVTSPGAIPVGDCVWSIGDGSVKQERRGLTEERKRLGGRRFCNWCNLYKPDRAYHCRICRCCVLHMEQHSSFLNTCIGFRNHRFYCQALFWGVVTYALMSRSLPEAWKVVVDPKRNALSRAWTLAASIGMVVDGMFNGCLLGLEAWLLWKNMTKIEYFEKSRRPNAQSQSHRQHKLTTWRVNPIVWLLPIAPPPAVEGVML